MTSREPMHRDADDLEQALDALRSAGKEPDPAILERVKAFGPAAVQPLISIATNKDLLNAITESPEVWTPLNAVRLLGELCAGEAVEPLLPLLELDDDWIPPDLAKTYGLIGAPALGPLRSFLFDRSHEVWGRVYAADALAKLAQYHPEHRADVVATLVDRLVASETQVDDDYMLNGCVISDLLDIQAIEALEDIQKAYDEDRVDQMIAGGFEEVLSEFGLRPKKQVDPLIDLRRPAAVPEQSALAAAVARPNPPEAAARRAFAQSPAQRSVKVGRNDLCPCGSGKKYKKCHGG